MEKILVCEEDDSDLDDDVSCCVCRHARPLELNNANYLVITQWAQCETCGHWNHLKFSSTVCVDRNDTHTVIESKLFTKNDTRRKC